MIGGAVDDVSPLCRGGALISSLIGSSAARTPALIAFAARRALSSSSGTLLPGTGSATGIGPPTARHRRAW